MIREFRETDADAIIEIWFAASKVATPFLSAEFLAAEREQIRTVWLRKAGSWVYEIADVVVGFISLIGNEVGAIFVHPNYQGRGIGRALMDHAVDLRGSLFLDVFRENVMGRRFYDRYGFRLAHEHIHEDTDHVQMRMIFSPDR
ncbi:MAG TPA: GNAT family N-acetyltransferase [Gammaproteobacteria bacterium]